MDDIYHTIAETAESQFVEKRSRFIAYAVPVQSAETVMEILKTYRAKYHDARHICWAYVLGPERTVFRANDNGEPSGTAGRPIMGQINSMGLTDVLVLVVRYFGGIKLGAPGLTAAYRRAAREALEAATVVDKCVMASLTVRFPYPVLSAVMTIVDKSGARIDAQEFECTCTMTLSTARSQLETLRKRLTDLDGISIVD